MSNEPGFPAPGFEAEWLDSETFAYQGSRHRVLRRQHGDQENNRWLTAAKHVYYMWRSDSHGYMWWECWDEFLHDIILAWKAAEKEDLIHIELAHDGFVACSEDFAHTNIGSEIEIIPRDCYPLCEYSEKWVVDLVIPTGTETCVFDIYGKERVDWFNKRARLDEPMIIALRKFNFEEVVI